MPENDASRDEYHSLDAENKGHYRAEADVPKSRFFSMYQRSFQAVSSVVVNF
jgi:hypothetical protein